MSFNSPAGPLTHRIGDRLWQKTFIRDIFQPALGSTFLIHEVFFLDQPRAVVMAAGFALLGGPLAALADRVFSNTSENTPPK